MKIFGFTLDGVYGTMTSCGDSHAKAGKNGAFNQHGQRHRPQVTLLTDTGEINVIIKLTAYLLI